MLYYIKGRIVEICKESVILDNHGIGFEIYTTGRVLQELIRSGKEEILLYTHLQIKEDERVFHGFGSGVGFSSVERPVALLLAGLAPQEASSNIADRIGSNLFIAVFLSFYTDLSSLVFTPNYSRFSHMYQRSCYRLSESSLGLLW